jgi:hypothetical protein
MHCVRKAPKNVSKKLTGEKFVGRNVTVNLSCLYHEKLGKKSLGREVVGHTVIQFGDNESICHCEIFRPIFFKLSSGGSRRTISLLFRTCVVLYVILSYCLRDKVS